MQIVFYANYYASNFEAIHKYIDIGSTGMMMTNTLEYIKDFTILHFSPLVLPRILLRPPLLEPRPDPLF